VLLDPSLRVGINWILEERTGNPYLMNDQGFEWDDDKAAENRRRHRVSFEEATLAVGDPFAIEWLDTREAYGEERIVLVGMSQGRLLTVVYAQRAERLRIISARRATKHEQDDYFRQNAP
jgi:uncharacterized DUF497 family protein